MKREQCRKEDTNGDTCDNDTFYIVSQSVNGGYTADRICTKCEDITEIIDTYNDQNHGSCDCND